MTDTILTMGVDSRPAEAGGQRIVATFGKISDSGERVNATVRRQETQFKQLRSVADQLRGTLIGLAGALSIRRIIQYSDQWKQLEGRLRVVTRGTQEFNRVQQQLITLADSARSSIGAVTNLYSRLSMAVGDNMRAQKLLLPVTEAIAKGIAITGESASSAQGAIVQFSQGLATNFSAAGQEIRSLQEQAPRVAKALADGLNVLGFASNATAGSLNRLAQDGVINAEKAMLALESQLGVLRREFEQTPVTISQALTRLDNAFLTFIGRSDAVEAGSGALVLAITAVANNFDLLAQAVTTAATAYTISMLPALARYTAALVAPIASTISMNAALGAMAFSSSTAGAALGAMRGSVVALGAAMRLVPLVAFAAVLTQLVVGFGDASEATMRYNLQTAELSEAADIAIRAEGRLTDAVKRQVNARIQERVKELETVRVQLDALNNSDGNLFGPLGVAGQELFGALGVGDRPSQIIARADAITGAIRDLREILERDASSVSGAGGGGGANDELEKFDKKLRDMLDDSIFERHTIGLSDLGQALAGVDRFVEDNVGGFDRLTAEQQQSVTQIKENIRATLEQEQALERQKNALNENAEVFREFGRDIQNTFTDAFEGTLRDFDSFFDQLKNAFRRLLANMATLAIAQPIIVPIITAAGGFFGLDDATLQATTQQLGGGGLGLGNLGSFGSFFSGGSNLLSGATDFINRVGADIFGTFSGVGPQLPGVDQTLTGILGDSLSGAAIGGLAANLLGLGSGNAFVDTGLSLGGAALGNLLLPGIGGVLGSFAGTAVGGLLGFGNDKPPDNTSAGSVRLGENRRFDLAGNEATVEFRDQTFAYAESLANNIASITGRALDDQLTIRVGQRDGLRFRVGENGIEQNFGTDTDAFFSNLTQEIFALADTSEQGATAIENINLALGNIGFEDLNQTLSDIQFAAGFDQIAESFIAAREPIDQFDQELDALEAQFDSLRETTTRLGLPLESLEDQIGQINDAIRDEVNETLRDRVIGQTSGLIADLLTEQRRYQAELENAQRVGADLTLINTINANNVAEIQERYGAVQDTQLQTLQATEREAESLRGTFERLVKSLDDDINALRVGNLSPLSPTARFDEALLQFNDTLAQAQSGNIEAIEDLPDIGNTLLEIARENFGSTQQFVDTFNLVEGGLKDVRNEVRDQLSVQEQIAASAREQVTALQTLSDTILGSDLVKVSSLANPNVKVTPGNPNETVIANFSAIERAGLQDTVIEILKASTNNIAPGNGARSIFFEQNPLIAQEVVNTFRALGIPGFVNGGITPINSPFLVGERGPEVLSFNRSARVTPIAANDNDALLTEVRTLNRNIERMVDQQGDIEQTQEEIMSELGDVLKRLERTLKRAS